MAGNPNISRRRLLSTTGGVVTGNYLTTRAIAKQANSKPPQSQQHRLVLNSPSSVRVTYEFVVTGDVTKTTNTGGLFSENVVTTDPEDHVISPNGFEGIVVRGVTQGGVDAYVYTGEIIAFDSTNCSEFNVWVNGTEQSACALNENYNAEVGSATDENESRDDTDETDVTVERVRPNPEVTVVPGTRLLFEFIARNYRGARLSKRIYVDGEGGHGGEPDLFYEQLDTANRDVLSLKFDTKGTHRVRIDVYDANETRLGTVRWTVNVSNGGNEPPAVERVAPSQMVLSVSPNSQPTHDFTIRATDPDGSLDSVVWWTSQCDQLLGTASLQGASATATLSYEVYPGCPVAPFVIDDTGAITWFSGWLIREDGSSRNYVRFESTGEGTTTYEFSASEDVRQLGIRPNPARDATVNGTRVTGEVGPRRDEDLFYFAGEITDLTVNGPATVYVNGSQIDPSAYSVR